MGWRYLPPGVPITTIRRGKYSMDVREIQSLLADFGWPIAVDGVNGPQTKAAIADFQHGYAFINLEVDGVVGPDLR